MAIAAPSSSLHYPPGGSFSSIRRRALNWIMGTQSDPQLDATARDAVNGAINRLNSRTWFKITSYQVIYLTADQADYSINSDFKDPRNLARYNSDGNPDGYLEFKDEKSFVREHSRATGSGNPRVYTAFHDARVITLDLAPSQGFVSSYPTLRLRYFYRQPHLMNDADMLRIPAEYQEFIVWYAREELAGIRGDAQKAAIAMSKHREIWAELKAQDSEVMTDFSEVY